MQHLAPDAALPRAAHGGRHRRSAHRPTGGAARCHLLGPAVACLLAAVAMARAAPSVAATPAASPAATDAMLYDVEMVVFRAASVGPEEDWSIAPTTRGFGTVITQGATAPEVVRILPSSAYRLDGIMRGLRVSGEWRPIAHAAWVQTAPPWGTHIGIPLSQVGLDVPGLTGSVYLERAKLFLHLGFDVSLQSGATYTIDEMHNVRQNEKEYFDHPAFGIIAVVTPVRRAAP
jgi:hypothetical protein